MAVCKWYLLNIRCFLSCVQIFEHFLNTLRPHFCVALCHLAVGAKIALKRGKKNCKPLFRDLHFLCELFRSRIIKFYVIWLKNVVFRLFAHSFRPRPPFNPIFSFSLKTHKGEPLRARQGSSHVLGVAAWQGPAGGVRAPRSTAHKQAHCYWYVRRGRRPLQAICWFITIFQHAMGPGFGGVGWPRSTECFMFYHPL